MSRFCSSVVTAIIVWVYVKYHTTCWAAAQDQLFFFSPGLVMELEVGFHLENCATASYELGHPLQLER